MIGAALNQEVIQEELRDGGPFQVLPFFPPDISMEEEQRMVTQLARMIHIIGDRIEDDPELRDAIDRVAQYDESRWKRFEDVARIVLQDGFTWERIILLYHVARRLEKSVFGVSRFVEICTNLLRWILDRGRWILELDNSLFVSVILRSVLYFLCSKLRSWIRERGSEKQDCVHVNRLSAAVQNASERLRNDQEFQAGIEAVARVPGSRWENFNQVAENAVGAGMTWETVAVLNYVFGVMAIRMDHWSVRDIVRWTMNLFDPNGLRLAHEDGRQISGSSETTSASANGTASRSSFIIIFIAGVALGSFVTWRVTRSL